MVATYSLSNDDITTLQSIQKKKAELKYKMLRLKYEEAHALLGNAVLSNKQVRVDDSNEQEEWDYFGYQIGYVCS